MRAGVAERLGWIGLALLADVNARDGPSISMASSRSRAM
jgi:hypothetical protein